MTRARESIIDLEATPYYHCICRCVRRAFLCGEDEFSGQSYEHRRQWIVERLAYLTKVFAIEVASYAVMSNHYHLVLRVDKKAAEGWSETEIIRRWKKLCKIPEVITLYRKNPDMPGVDFVAQDLIETWRQRLMDISWLMRFLNEYLARKANAEDGCKGRFWEGRFKSQPLLDEAAVITAMSYVDLNPIRAKMAKTPEKSDYTSVQQRIQELRGKTVDNSVPLITLSASSQQRHSNSFAFSLEDYLQLVDWAGRAILKNKRGYIDANQQPILQRLNINAEGFIELMQKQDDLSQLSVMGSTTALSHYVERLEKKFVRGLSINQRLFT
jgi:REP element-mobilizing transposase RayT